MSTPLSTCPRCAGEKQFSAIIQGAIRSIKCHTCGGTGLIDDDHLDRIERGMEMARQRRAANLSIRQAAEQRGIKVGALADMEQGRSEPVPFRYQPSRA